MYSWNKIRAARNGYMIMSIILCVMGLMLIAVPGVSAMLLCRAGGLIMLMFGVVKLIGYCSRDLYRLAFQHDLAFGILLILVGGIMIFRTAPVISVLCAILAVYVMADALLKIQISIEARAFGIRKWWLILAAAVLTGIISFLLLFRPTESAEIIMMLLGLALLTEGILNLITILTAVKVTRRQEPEIIDIDYEEV